jgi:hypothetical protein
MGTPVDGLLHERAQRAQLAEVRGHAERLAAHRPEMLLGLPAGLGLAARDDDLRTGGDVALGERAPDAARAAGHDHHAAAQVEERTELFSVQGALFSCL